MIVGKRRVVVPLISLGVAILVFWIMGVMWRNRNGDSGGSFWKVPEELAFEKRIREEEKKGIKFSSDGRTLQKVPDFITEYDIPDGVFAIGFMAFSDNSYLRRVTIPSSVTTIEDYAFYDCSSLENVTIPSNVTAIGSRAFGSCKKLTDVTIEYGVTAIGDWAFSGCSSLRSITIPGSVTSIGTNAFSSCPCESQVRRDHPTLYR